MRIAVLALTDRGGELARQVQRLLPEVPDVYVPEKIEPEGFEVKHFFTFPKFGEAFSGCFTHYDALVCIMAAGIVVRTMAPLLRNKLTDPAVIVCDEQGRFAISLLSGHVGGANFLTRQLAEVIGAQPVITTADGAEAKKIENVYVTCLHFCRLK
jgi:cobalt-precorrin 5A hydrolase